MIRAPTTWSDCHNHGERRSGPRIDFCTDCIVVFGAGADDYIAALVLTLQHRWDTWGKKKKVCGLFLLP